MVLREKAKSTEATVHPVDLIAPNHTRGLEVRF